MGSQLYDASSVPLYQYLRQEDGSDHLQEAIQFPLRAYFRSALEYLQVSPMPYSLTVHPEPVRLTHSRPSFRYQLEAFCNQIRGNKPHHWVPADDSIQQMETIDAIYEKSGLGKRMPTAELV
jgi:predicted dehydrogenase